MTAPDQAAADIEVRAAEEAFFAGLLAGDATALEQVLAEDFVLVDVLNGDVVPRIGLLEALRAGDLAFLSVARDEAEVLIRHRPGVAVVVGRTRMAMRYLGVQAAAGSRYTHVYVHDGQRWRLLTAQGTRLSDDSAETG